MPGDLTTMTAADVLSLTPSELLRELARVGVKPDLEAIQAEADRIIAKVLAAARAGQVLDDGAIAAVERQVELAAEGIIRRQVKAAVRSYREVAIRQVKTSVMEIWIAVVSGSCPDCLNRHGLVKTRADWDELGRPGDPALLCNGECRCQTFPMPNAAGVDPYVELEAELSRVEIVGAP